MVDPKPKSHSSVDEWLTLFLSRDKSVPPDCYYRYPGTCLNCFFELFEPLLCEADLREPSLSLRGTRGPQNAFIRSPSATAVTPPPWLARPLPASLRDTPPNLAPARPS